MRDGQISGKRLQRRLSRALIDAGIPSKELITELASRQLNNRRERGTSCFRLRLVRGVGRSRPRDGLVMA